MPASLNLKVPSPSARVRATCPATPTVGSNARTRQAERCGGRPRRNEARTEGANASRPGLELGPSDRSNLLPALLGALIGLPEIFASEIAIAPHVAAIQEWCCRPPM